MDSFIELAKEIHKRNNQKLIGMCVGEYVSHAPATIRIYYNGVPLDFTEFFNITGLINGDTGVTTGDLYVDEYPNEIGDKFICMTGNDNQCLYVLGKFEQIGTESDGKKKELNIYLR